MMTTPIRSMICRGGLSTVAAAAMIAVVFAAPASAGEKNPGSESRGSLSRNSISSKSPGSGSTSATRSSAGVTRSQGRSSGGTANRGSSSSPPRRHYPSDSYYRHRNYWGFGWGYGHYAWGSYRGYYPYYPIFPTIYYGPHPGQYRDYRLGALDLNVKPKKTEVWVDGQLVGPSGKFDGFPGYLWLERGRHQLVFHRPGFKTESREVRVLQGAVVRLHLRLEEGETQPPEDLVATREDRRRPSRRSSAKMELEESEPDRSEPGRLRLSIEPGDASVYLDGRFLGTAAELAGLHAGLIVEEGVHSLEIVRPGFRSETLELTVEPEDETDVALVLEAD